VTLASLHAPENPSETVPPARHSTIEYVSRGALIGAAVGTVVGLGTAVVLSQDATDHSEDGLAYLALGTFGALIGLLGGAIAGAVMAH
jgi:hypothetical protein